MISFIDLENHLHCVIKTKDLKGLLQFSHLIQNLENDHMKFRVQYWLS